MATSTITNLAQCNTVDATMAEKNDSITGVIDEDNHGSAQEAKGLFTQKLCMKIDLHVLTPMLFLNFLSLMGRTNIGAALIQKLPQELKLNAMKVFLAISIPLVPLILFEIPSNLIMRFLEKNYGLSYMRYLSAITICLGLVTLGQGFDKTYGALLATRFVVGIFDAGLIPGCVFVCSLYYPASHLQWRMSMLMVANISSNIVSSILAYAISEIHNSNGYHGWRWIFIIEGCLTMGIGTVCLVSNIGRPEKASWLSESEKDTISHSVSKRTTSIGTLAEWSIFLRNPLNYVWASCYTLTCSTTYSVAIFAPSFVQAFHPHFTVPSIQGQVVPIFIVGSAACLLSAWVSDRLQHRASFSILGYIITTIGFGILRQQHISKPSIAMLGLYFVSIGTYISLPILWNLTLVNLPSPYQRAIGCGFVVGIGNVGGFISAWLFRTSEAPHYRKGMTDSMVFTLICLALIIVAWVYISVENRSLGKVEGVDEKDGVRASGQVLRYRV